MLPLGKDPYVAINPKCVNAGWMLALTHATAFIVKPDGAQLARLSELIESGSLRPVIEQVFPLSEAQYAYQRVLGSHTQGKLVLRVMSHEGGLLST